MIQNVFPSALMSVYLAGTLVAACTRLPKRHILAAIYSLMYPTSFQKVSQALATMLQRLYFVQQIYKESSDSYHEENLFLSNHKAVVIPSSALKVAICFGSDIHTDFIMSTSINLKPSLTFP